MDKNCVRRLLIALAVLLPQYAAAENGVTKDKIVLGQSVALTGPAAQLGIQMRNGVRAYLDYVNAQGGVHGRKIELITLDDGYEQAGLKGTEIAMAKRGLKVSALGTVERNTIKVEDAVKAINAAKPDAVVMISQYTSCAEFIRQMKKSGSAATFYNVSFVGSKALANALGSDGVGVAISQVMPFPWGRRFRSSRSTSGSRPRRATPISISARSRASSWPRSSSRGSSALAGI